MIHVQILKIVILYSKILCWYIFSLLICKWVDKKANYIPTNLLCET